MPRLLLRPKGVNGRLHPRTEARLTYSGYHRAFLPRLLSEPGAPRIEHGFEILGLGVVQRCPVAEDRAYHTIVSLTMSRREFRKGASGMAVLIFSQGEMIAAVALVIDSTRAPARVQVP